MCIALLIKTDVTETSSLRVLWPERKRFSVCFAPQPLLFCSPAPHPGPFSFSFFFTLCGETLLGFWNMLNPWKVSERAPHQRALHSMFPLAEPVGKRRKSVQPVSVWCHNTGEETKWPIPEEAKSLWTSYSTPNHIRLSWCPLILFKQNRSYFRFHRNDKCLGHKGSIGFCRLFFQWYAFQCIFHHIECRWQILILWPTCSLLN